MDVYSQVCSDMQIGGKRMYDHKLCLVHFNRDIIQFFMNIKSLHFLHRGVVLEAGRIIYIFSMFSQNVT